MGKTVKHTTQAVENRTEKGMHLTHRDGWKYTEAKDVKVVQMDEKLNKLVKSNLGLINLEGVEFILDSVGHRGLRVKFEDGTEKFIIVDRYGKVREHKMTKFGLMQNTLWTKVERFFGISDELRAKPTKKIDFIHLCMFLLGVTVVGGLFGLLAWFINSSQLLGA